MQLGLRERVVCTMGASLPCTECIGGGHLQPYPVIVTVAPAVPRRYCTWQLGLGERATHCLHYLLPTASYPLSPIHFLLSTLSYLSTLYLQCLLSPYALPTLHYLVNSASSTLPSISRVDLTNTCVLPKGASLPCTECIGGGHLQRYPLIVTVL